MWQRYKLGSAKLVTQLDDLCSSYLGFCDDHHISASRQQRNIVQQCTSPAPPLLCSGRRETSVASSTFCLQLGELLPQGFACYMLCVVTMHKHMFWGFTFPRCRCISPPLLAQVTLLYGAAVGNKVAQKPLYFTMLSAQNGENCEQNKLIFVVCNFDEKSRSGESLQRTRNWAFQLKSMKYVGLYISWRKLWACISAYILLMENSLEES